MDETIRGMEDIGDIQLMAMLRKRFILIVFLTFITLSLTGSGVGRSPSESHAASAMFPFVLPYDDSSHTLIDISGWNESAAGSNGFIKSVDGHFYSGGDRIRFLGVNMTMGANFPSFSEAKKVAARMAKFGINMVRIHHLDYHSAPEGILKEDLVTFDSDQLTRLDYFIYQMKINGIYVDLNLHVSRTYPGFPSWGDMPSYYKGIDHFCPKMIEMQKDYAKTLLTHKNRYTGKRYKDDPVVALIEINNESSLIHQWHRGKLDNMPAVFQRELESQYTRWLASGSSGQAQAAASTTGRSAVKKAQFGSLSVEEQTQWLEFLYYVEEKYFADMRAYLKEEIGAGSLIIGTQVGFSLAPIQQNMDVVAAHGYWQHPIFPGASWDPVNWYVSNIPMAGFEDGGKVRSLASFKVVGRPYLVGEYSHPAPNTYGSEGLLLAAAYAALQDWDGILLYEYNSRTDDWDPQYVTGYFSLDSNPAKMAVFQAAAALFRRGDVLSAPEIAVAESTKEAALEITRKYGPEYVNADRMGRNAMECMYYRIGISFGQTATADRESLLAGLLEKVKQKLTGLVGRSSALTSTTNEVTWYSGNSDGMVTVNTPKSKLFVGYIQGRQIDFNGLVVSPSSELQDWAALSLTVMEGDGFSPQSRILLTATGYFENTDMGWKDAEKTTVGQDWGRPPSLVEGIKAVVQMPFSPDAVRVWSLDNTGERDREIAVGESGGLAYFEIGPEYETLWYEIAIN